MVCGKEYRNRWLADHIAVQKLITMSRIVSLDARNIGRSRLHYMTMRYTVLVFQVCVDELRLSIFCT